MAVKTFTGHFDTLDYFMTDLNDAILKFGNSDIIIETFIACNWSFTLND